MDLQKIETQFLKTFGGETPPRLFFAPGRVNLIGEHTDYNGGYVFPCALNLGTYGAIRKRNDSVIRLTASGFEPDVTVSVTDLSFNPIHKWANYVKGVAYELVSMGYTLGGFDFYITGDLPNKAGLSSSASVELLTCVALDALFNLQIDPVEKTLLCQRAENNYTNVNCGIMDQFASGMGRKDHALLLNCGTMEYKYVPLLLGDYTVVIANTNNKRGLTDTQYNERRLECEAALKDLQKKLELKNLCDITPIVFSQIKQIIDNPVHRNRAAHAIYENARTLQAVEALEDGNLKMLGKLMNESHISLRDLYEVTGDELDALAESAWACEGVLGSRMTGAGFGGCTVSIVEKGKVNSFIDKVNEAYTLRTGLQADFYIAQTGDGAGEVFI